MSLQPVEIVLAIVKDFENSTAAWLKKLISFQN